jgi:demethylmenaquinone methyltransferase/2-methoxy-6-polyprenyl-1,4-benzoquinol methylase
VTSPPSRRGQRVYDLWAEYDLPYRVVDRLTRSLRAEGIRRLAPEPGATVLDLGCGPGGSLPALSRAVGPSGTVLGVDYSAAMVDRAADRAAATDSASVLRADAAGLPVRADSVDGVFASLALSAMPELGSVLDEVTRVVRPGGRLAVVDARVPDGPAGTVLRRAYRWLVNVHNPDVLAALETRFATVTEIDTFDAGLGFVARVGIE